MAVFGNPTGPIYCLGTIVVAIAGTPVPLNQNVSTNTGFGISAAGIPGSQFVTKGTPSPMVAQQLIFRALTTNVNKIYLCFAGGNKATPNSIILDLDPGQFFNLASGLLTNPFMLSLLVIDADTAANAVRATAIIM